MKLSEDVTRDMLADVVDWFRHDLHEYLVDAEEAYKKDKTDNYSRDVATIYRQVEDMLYSRLSTIEDE